MDDFSNSRVPNSLPAVLSHISVRRTRYAHARTSHTHARTTRTTRTHSIHTHTHTRTHYTHTPYTPHRHALRARHAHTVQTHTHYAHYTHTHKLNKVKDKRLEVTSFPYMKKTRRLRTVLFSCYECGTKKIWVPDGSWNLWPSIHRTSRPGLVKFALSHTHDRLDSNFLIRHRVHNSPSPSPQNEKECVSTVARVCRITNSNHGANTLFSLSHMLDFPPKSRHNTLHYIWLQGK